MNFMVRHPAIVVLFVLAAAIPARLSRGASPHAIRPASTFAALAAPEDTGTMEPGIPQVVRDAAKQGRYWRASRLLAAHLHAAADTSPATLLVASELNAGWGDWPSVARLLEGRAWLDSVGGGRGWALLARAKLRDGRSAQAVDALTRYLAVATPGDSALGVAELRRALALEDAGETERALSAFDSASAAVPWFGDWIALFAARVAAEAGDTAEVARRLTHVSRWLDRDRGWRIRFEAATKAEDPMLAREVALAAARNADQGDERADAWARLGRLRLEGGDSTRAGEAFRSAMDAAPGAAAAVEAARGLSGLAPSQDDWRMIGEIYLRHGFASGAAEALGHYLGGGGVSEVQRRRIRAAARPRHVRRRALPGRRATASGAGG